MKLTMSKVLPKIAAILALFIGAMSVFVGLRVLLEIDTKSYTVQTWLVVYNVLFGILSILAAYYIWNVQKKCKNKILFILSMHLLIFMYLKFFDNQIALESINAMIFRVSIWILISFFAIVIPNYLRK